MRKVQCYDCGKRYDFDVDDFCPKCGAFTLPPRTSRMDVHGSVVRDEGINERNHRNSFVHAEWHGENQTRRGTALERPRKPAAKPVTGRRLQPPGSASSKLPLGTLGGALDLVTDLFDL